MKIITISTVCYFLSMMILNGQVVMTKSVLFDTYQSVSNNDLVNNFSNGNGLVQIQTNGMTGGCLVSPDSINWGNDNAVYCNRFHPFTGDTISAGICFKFDAAAIKPGSVQRAVSLWLSPYADFNHYIIGTINYNQRMELLTYGWNNNPSPIASLQNNHWYLFELSAIISGGINNQVIVKSIIYDLGTTGSSFVFVNSSSGTISDNVFAVDTSIQVSFTSAKYGGAQNLDEFVYYGRNGVSNCITTSINELNSQPAIRTYPSPCNGILNIDIEKANENDFIYAVLLNPLGEMVLKKELSGLHTHMDVSMLKSGIYFLKCTGTLNKFSSKIIIRNE